MIFYIFILNSFLLLMTLINFFTMRRPTSIANSERSILVLLPVRNEERNIERVIQELESQQGTPRLNVLIINDNSNDRTFELAQVLSSERIAIINAPVPRDGWLGKVSALQSGFEQSNDYDIVISIDADVSFKPDAIARAVNTLEALDLDFISPYPRQESLSWAERLSQPLLQWSWMSTLFLRGAEKFPQESTVVCNGQFLVMRGSSLSQLGGFSAVSKKVLDDIELGRSFVRAGFSGAVIDGSEIATTRMYSSLDEIKAGYGKSLHAAFGSIFGSLIAAAFITTTGLYSFISALTGNLIGIGALIAIVASRAISALASHSRIRDSFLHPASSLLFLYLLYFSWRSKGQVQWKGRTV